jgi:hypothetical protein
MELTCIAPPRIQKGGPSPEARGLNRELCPGGKWDGRGAYWGFYPGVAPGSFGADLTRQRRRRAVLEEAFGWLVGPVALLVMWKGIATWLILPVVICLSQRLSHACVSINSFVL